MKRYLKDIFPKIVRFSKRLDDVTVLTNKPWVMFSEDDSVREVWIFRPNGELIVSVNGIAAKGSWDYIQHARSLYVDVHNSQRLFNQAFVDDVAFLLKLDGKDDVLPFINETKLNGNFRLDSYLETQYRLVQPPTESTPERPSPPTRPTAPPRTAKQPRQYTFRDWVRDVKQKHAIIKLISMLGLIGIITVLIFRIVSLTDNRENIGRFIVVFSLVLFFLIIISTLRNRIIRRKRKI